MRKFRNDGKYAPTSTCVCEGLDQTLVPTNHSHELDRHIINYGRYRLNHYSESYIQTRYRLSAQIIDHEILTFKPLRCSVARQF